MIPSVLPHMPSAVISILYLQFVLFTPSPQEGRWVHRGEWPEADTLTVGCANTSNSSPGLTTFPLKTIGISLLTPITIEKYVI